MDPTSRLRGRRIGTLATELLRDLTVVTAVVGLAATAGFGWLASMTFAGAPATNSRNTVVTTTDDAATPGIVNPTPDPGRDAASEDGVERLVLERGGGRRRLRIAAAGTRVDGRVVADARTGRLASPRHDRAPSGPRRRPGERRGPASKRSSPMSMPPTAAFVPTANCMRLQATPRRLTPVSPLLWDAIMVALRVARETGGLVDPTVGRAMRIVGYDDDFDRVADRGPSTAGIDHPCGTRGGARLAGGRDRRPDPLRPVPAGVELDLGSTGKALAADLAAAAARAAASDGGILVSLGGDIATAGRAPEGGWRILAARGQRDSRRRRRRGHRHPDRCGRNLEHDRAALAFGRRRGATPSHRPATGGPVATPWRTVSVVADTCVAANGAATAAIVLGHPGLAWLEGRALPARLVREDGVIVRLGGWPDPDFVTESVQGSASAASPAEGRRAVRL